VPSGLDLSEEYGQFTAADSKDRIGRVLGVPYTDHRVRLPISAVVMLHGHS
jgi:hypothetical protein